MKTHIPKEMVEARSFIFWGHPVDEARESLLNHGVAPDRIEESLQAFVKEWNIALRQSGVRDLLLGILLLSLFLADCWRAWHGPVPRTIWAAFALMVIGVERTVRAVRKLLFPQKLKISLATI
jgi:hypothetical protein